MRGYSSWAQILRFTQDDSLGRGLTESWRVRSMTEW